MMAQVREHRLSYYTTVMAFHLNVITNRNVCAVRQLHQKVHINVETIDDDLAQMREWLHSFWIKSSTLKVRAIQIIWEKRVISVLINV